MISAAAVAELVTHASLQLSHPVNHQRWPPQTAASQTFSTTEGKINTEAAVPTQQPFHPLSSNSDSESSETITKRADSQSSRTQLAELDHAQPGHMKVPYHLGAGMVCMVENGTSERRISTHALGSIA